MKVEDLKEKKLRPLRDLVAIEWTPSKKTKSGFFIPETFYDFGLKLGKMYLCKILAKGPKVTQLKVGDRILVAEYGILSFPGTWKEIQIYFIEEKNCKAKITGIKNYLPSIPSEAKAEAFEKSL